MKLIHKQRKRPLKSYWNLLRNYRFQSMFFSYFFNITALLVIVFAVYTLFFYFLYSANSKDRITFFAQKSLHQTSNILTMILSKVEQQFYMIENGSDLSDFFNMDSTEDALTINQIKHNTINRLFTLAADNPQTHSIYVYSMKSTYVGAWNDFKPLDQFYDRAYIQDALCHKTLPMKRNHLNLSAGAPLISITKEIIDSYGDPAGIGVINLDYENLTAVMSTNSSDNTRITIVSPEGIIFFSNDVAKENQQISQLEEFSGVFQSVKQNHPVSMFRHGEIISAQMTPESYLIISQMPLDQFSVSSEQIKLFLLGCIAGIVTSFLLSFLASLRMYGYVIDLVTVFKSPLDTGTSPATAAESELQFVGQQIMSTLKRNETIENELADKLATLKKSQAISLQAQINPHFLLNTLQLISLDLMKESKKDTHTTLAISILSDILRSNLNTSEYIVSIEHEMLHAKKYVEMENLRCNGKYQVLWDIPAKLPEQKTVKFILQPILENAILHGLSSSENQVKLINVTVKKEGNTISFSVNDNGIGMPPSKLEQLRQNLASGKLPQSSHIGLCNVDMRIKLLCGNTYGISVDSVPYVGTTVTITHSCIQDYC